MIIIQIFTYLNAFNASNIFSFQSSKCIHFDLHASLLCFSFTICIYMQICINAYIYINTNFSYLQYQTPFVLFQRPMYPLCPYNCGAFGSFRTFYCSFVVGLVFVVSKCSEMSVHLYKYAPRMPRTFSEWYLDSVCVCVIASMYVCFVRAYYLSFMAANFIRTLVHPFLLYIDLCIQKYSYMYTRVVLKYPNYAVLIVVIVTLEV